MKHILPLVLTALSCIQYLPSVSATPLPGFPGFGPGPAVPPTAVSTATSTSSTSTTSTSATPSTSASSTQLNEINSILQNRLSIIVGGLASPSSISAWLSTLGANGQWPASEVDYTTGCAARRSNWPAQEHWQRISK
ncbi:hypothetical protein H0H81_005449 [Sphagnurus paluster]|uniref:Uncharacterized protein n=1 Tax=Sphagnurus paluster TaxID=117069 RepID=A0A9P7FY28_9AGAR|nr:hypothetical protein H0H81_005449 [Sphagnurus paluster]